MLLFHYPEINSNCKQQQQQQQQEQQLLLLLNVKGATAMPLLERRWVLISLTSAIEPIGG